MVIYQVNNKPRSDPRKEPLRAATPPPTATGSARSASCRLPLPREPIWLPCGELLPTATLASFLGSVAVGLWGAVPSPSGSPRVPLRSGSGTSPLYSLRSSRGAPPGGPRVCATVRLLRGRQARSPSGVSWSRSAPALSVAPLTRPPSVGVCSSTLLPSLAKVTPLRGQGLPQTPAFPKGKGRTSGRAYGNRSSL